MLGTAGLNREIAIVTAIKPKTEAAMMMIRRLRFFAATPTRGASIEERLGANPAGRTIVSSFDFRCGITVESELTNCSTKFAKGRCGAKKWRCGRSNDGCEENCFAHEIAPRFGLEILAADAAKRGPCSFGASSLVADKRPRLIIEFNNRKFPAVTSTHKDRFHFSVPFVGSC